MKGIEGKRKNLISLVLLIAGICCIIMATQAGILIFSSPETQNLVESTSVPYDQKKAVLYSEAMQEDNPAVREYAYLRTTVTDPDGEALLYVCNLWDDLNRNWKIVSDPMGPEYISPSSETIKADLRGDCDDYSVLLAGLSGISGAEMRIVNIAGTNGNPGHAYPECYLGDTESLVIEQCRYISARYDCDKVYYSFNGESGRTVYWLNLDWAAGRSPDAGYYIYGDSGNYHDLVHPGQSYAGVGQNAVFYYPDGSYAADTPGHGYYERDMFGKEVLNVIQV